MSSSPHTDEFGSSAVKAGSGKPLIGFSHYSEKISKPDAPAVAGLAFLTFAVPRKRPRIQLLKERAGSSASTALNIQIVRLWVDGGDH